MFLFNSIAEGLIIFVVNFVVKKPVLQNPEEKNLSSFQ